MKTKIELTDNEAVMAASSSTNSSATANDQAKEIRVNSFDFDGCLFNSRYMDSEEKDVIEANREFLTEIRSQNGNYFKNITFIGSNRQDKAMDVENTKKKGKVIGSCFPAIASVNDFIEAELDNLLLADIYGDLMDGESYRLGLLPVDKASHITHASWTWDESKATIIYAQMHKVASSHPSKQIVFNFYDDRLDIHERLNKFYSSYPRLLPSNVTLCLHHYEGENVDLKYSIKGNGFIDSNYRQSVKIMGATAKSNQGIDRMDAWSPVYVTDFIKPEEISPRDLTNSINDFIESLAIESRDEKLAVINYLHYKAVLVSIEKCSNDGTLDSETKLKEITTKRLAFIQENPDNDFLNDLEKRDEVPLLIESIMKKMEYYDKKMLARYGELRNQETVFSNNNNAEQFSRTRKQRAYLEELYPALSEWFALTQGIEHNCKKNARPVAASSSNTTQVGAGASNANQGFFTKKTELSKNDTDSYNELACSIM